MTPGSRLSRVMIGARISVPKVEFLVAPIERGGSAPLPSPDTIDLQPTRGLAVPTDLSISPCFSAASLRPAASALSIVLPLRKLQ